MTIKYAYLDQTTREYAYADTREALIDILAQNAAKVFVEHYCNNQPYTIVETQEDGLEKWYSPTGAQVMTPTEIATKIKQRQSFANAGEITVSVLGGQ